MRPNNPTSRPVSVRGSAHGVPIRVLIVDDHPTIREALALAFSDTPDLVCCGVAASAGQAFDLVSRERPTAVVMDIMLGDGDGLDLVGRLHAIRPDVPVILFSMLDESRFAERALAQGAMGYVMKTEPMAVVVDAVRAGARGDVHVSSTVRARLLAGLRRHGRPVESSAADPLAVLNGREVSVVLLLGQGQGVGAIAESLALGTKTVEAIRRSAARKLGFETHSTLSQFALACVAGHDRRTPAN